MTRYTSYGDDSAFPPLPTSTASSSSSSLTEPDPCKGTTDSSQTKAESSLTTPSINGLSQRAAEAAPSTLNSQTLPEPSISVSSSSSSLSSTTNSTSFPQEARSTALYVSAVVNGRTNPHDEAATKLDERTWPPLEAHGATVEATGNDDTSSSVSVEMTAAEQQQQPLDVESDSVSSPANGLSQIQEEQVPVASGTPLKDDVVEGGEEEKATEMADERTWPAVEEQEVSASTESLKSKDSDQ